MIPLSISHYSNNLIIPFQSHNWPECIVFFSAYFSCLISFINAMYNHNMTNAKIKNNLKALRKAAGLRQQDLATQLGFIAFDRISKWEMGLFYPSVPHLAKMMSIFNVRLSDIFPDIFDNPC